MACPSWSHDRRREAARWAPSANNSQPWRFVYARRGTPDWDRFLALLLPFNQTWVQHASLLIFVLPFAVAASTIIANTERFVGWAQSLAA